MTQKHNPQSTGGRPIGAKNRQKTVAELVKMLQDAADREGVNLTDAVAGVVASASVSAAEGKDAATIAANAKRIAFSRLEIDIPDDDNEPDIFKCGACQAIMGAALKNCPECGAGLTWK